jgi:hypothetical protein
MFHIRHKSRVIKQKDLVNGIQTISEAIEVLKQLKKDPNLQDKGVLIQKIMYSGLMARVEEYLAALKRLEPQNDEVNSNTTSRKS